MCPIRIFSLQTQEGLAFEASYIFDLVLLLKAHNGNICITYEAHLSKIQDEYVLLRIR